ncbi:MAG: glyoxylate/hydroxypyruvate reductase A [Pseudomonadota bacterium]
MALLVIGRHEVVDKHYDEICQQAPRRDVRLWPETGDRNDIEHALAWHPEPGELAKLPNLRTIVSVGAGVDHLFKDPALPNLPVIRYVDPDLTGRMVEYVTLNVLLHTRRMLEHRDHQAVQNWVDLPAPAAHQVRVGIMGLGVLGSAAAVVLNALGYNVRGWTRCLRQAENVLCFAGKEQLGVFLAETDILVVLLPDTQDTHGMINRSLIQQLSLRGRHPRLPGPILINAGRGGVQVEADILAALDADELYAASLDVFETEPLPATSPLWNHPRVSITPHNAAVSMSENIAVYFLRHVERMENGEPAENIIDRSVGY